MDGMGCGTSRRSSMGVGASISVFYAYPDNPCTALFSLALLITRIENLCFESSYYYRLVASIISDVSEAMSSFFCLLRGGSNLSSLSSDGGDTFFEIFLAAVETISWTTLETSSTVLGFCSESVKDYWCSFLCLGAFFSSFISLLDFFSWVSL